MATRIMQKSLFLTKRFSESKYMAFGSSSWTATWDLLGGVLGLGRKTAEII